MSIRSMSTSITLTNQEDKIYLIFKGFSNGDSKKSNMIEVDDVVKGTK